jgi:hypothetical protein
MNLKNQPPIFVPPRFCSEIEKLSKATLMDMVWDYATRSVGDETAESAIMIEVRATAEAITIHRERAAPAFRQRQRELKESFREMDAAKGPAGSPGTVGWMGGEFDR